jgi:hypothetical protein
MPIESYNIEKLDVFTYYNKQRFTQFGSMDCANWYNLGAPDTKKTQAMYPSMGRAHINYFGVNELVFNVEPSQVFKTINYMYYIVDSQVIQVDKFYHQVFLGNVPLNSQNWFDFLPVGNLVYAVLTAQTVMYLITENNGVTTFEEITDTNAPTQPLFVATFGNSFVVSQQDTPNFYVSNVNAEGGPTKMFTSPLPPAPVGGPTVLNAGGVVRQLGALHNQLYVFTDFTTSIWANIPSQVTIGNVTTQLPFKQNSSYNWDYGIADPFSLSIDFGRMVFLGKNASGLVSFMASNGQQPINISTQAINVILENSKYPGVPSPFLAGNVDGFIYQYENTVFYRVSGGEYRGYQSLDLNETSFTLEFNFDTQTWTRAIELNGERNRIEKHVFFNNIHYVTVQDDPAVYQMAGNIYYNELRTLNTNPDVPGQYVNSQAPNAFTKYPMRYELVTQQIFEQDYAEFMTKWIEIDFVWGDQTFVNSLSPFDNTVFIITEDAGPQGQPIFVVAEDQPGGENVFLITEDGNTPGFDDNHYNSLFKPNIFLYLSDDGGVTYEPCDLREFSQLGMYRWRMRWYELGCSRNRCYKLICVSSAPIVILGGIQNKGVVSGGAR